jgi:hypothetical protein
MTHDAKSEKRVSTSPCDVPQSFRELIQARPTEGMVRKIGIRGTRTHVSHTVNPGEGMQQGTEEAGGTHTQHTLFVATCDSFGACLPTWMPAALGGWRFYDGRFAVRSRFKLKFCHFENIISARYTNGSLPCRWAGQAHPMKIMFGKLGWLKRSGWEGVKRGIHVVNSWERTSYLLVAWTLGSLMNIFMFTPC